MFGLFSPVAYTHMLIIDDMAKSVKIIGVYLSLKSPICRISIEISRTIKYHSQHLDGSDLFVPFRTFCIVFMFSPVTSFYLFGKNTAHQWSTSHGPQESFIHVSHTAI